ncbi:hypothetical protein EDD35_7901 [Amycolatopsis thermoflava]|uniref:Uncharacterized protein n=1 Tax=Amycolatopsis thermoflava TaxID=84480 RepID=A0A3N2G687_9PSEU|nr:hypothetical protein EDD35_7901 [Amycolatopsis thermoflava]
MAALVRSYLAGSWHTPADEGKPLLDAATGEEEAMGKYLSGCIDEFHAHRRHDSDDVHEHA